MTPSVRRCDLTPPRSCTTNEARALNPLLFTLICFRETRSIGRRHDRTTTWSDRYACDPRDVSSEFACVAVESVPVAAHMAAVRAGPVAFQGARREVPSRFHDQWTGPSLHAV